MNNGFIVLHRSMLDWEWYTDEKVSRLFIHCLLKANHADNKFRGKIINRGSFQTSYQMLSEQTGLSVRNIRTSLNKLKTTGELTIKTSSKNTVIVINNYDYYQSNDKQSDKQVTNKRQASDKQVTTNNNDNNVNNENKKDKPIEKPLGQVMNEMVVNYTTNPELRKALQEFIEFRKSTKPALTELAFTKSLNTLTRLYATDDAKKIEAIDQSIENGWKGIFDTKGKGKQQDKLTYKWQGELKAEQDEYDSRVYEPKRSPEEAKDKWNKL